MCKYDFVFPGLNQDTMLTYWKKKQDTILTYWKKNQDTILTYWRKDSNPNYKKEK